VVNRSANTGQSEGCGKGVSMLTGLVNSLMARIQEEAGDYFDFSEQEKKHEQE
jgi:hypothetical protein